MRPALDSAGHQVPRTKPTCLLHTWRPYRWQPFTLVLHLHQHQSSRNQHLQYLAKNQSTQHCQSLITPGSDHPPVLEPHMVLSRLADLGPLWPASGLLRAVSVPKSSRVFPDLHAGPCRQFLFGLDKAPCPARFGSFLTGSSEFFIFSGLVLRLLGVMFTSLLDLYRASRSCHEVLNELIVEALLSTLKSCINTKLQNRHARTNLVYQVG
jgi:hypothetical protein